jgi:hypothetical protein
VGRPALPRPDCGRQGSSGWTALPASPPPPPPMSRPGCEPSGAGKPWRLPGSQRSPSRSSRRGAEGAARCSSGPREPGRRTRSRALLPTGMPRGASVRAKARRDDAIRIGPCRDLGSRSCRGDSGTRAPWRCAWRRSHRRPCLPSAPRSPAQGSRSACARLDPARDRPEMRTRQPAPPRAPPRPSGRQPRAEQAPRACAGEPPRSPLRSCGPPAAWPTRESPCRRMPDRA